MRIFIAGATGVIGRRIARLLLTDGHRVAGMTRSDEGLSWLHAQGIAGYQVDAYDREAVVASIADFAPDVLLHQLTDLPDRAEDLHDMRGANARIRVEGTRHLIDAARNAGVARLLAQSVAWTMPPGVGADAVEFLERSVLDEGGTVLRYGQLYGEGTFYPRERPGHPRIHVDAAASTTVALLDRPPGVHTLVEPED